MKRIAAIILALMIPLGVYGAKQTIYTTDNHRDAILYKLQPNFTELYGYFTGIFQPSLATPTINDFTNATHNHAYNVNNGGGMYITNTNIASPTFSGSLSTVGTFVWGGTPTITENSWNDVSFLNSWTNYGSPYTNVQYKKDVMGFVHLRGVAKNSSVSGAAIFNLPSGYRPETSGSGMDLLFRIGQQGTQDMLSITGYNSTYGGYNPGDVYLTATGIFACLDGVTFKAY